MAGEVKLIATFTREHPTTGEPQTRDAYTPDEVVNLTADGWVQQKSSRPASGTTSSPAEKPAGGKPN